MQLRIFFFFTQLIILHILQGPVPVKAIDGFLVRPVHVNEFPAIVCLSTYEPAQPIEDTVFCTGTLISENHILTAEACLYNLGNNAIHATIGTGDLMHGSCTYPVWWIGYDYWAQRLRLNVHGRFNNIAIMKIIGVIPQIRIPPISQINPLTLLDGHDAEIYGCSPLEELDGRNMIQTAIVKILKRQTCAQTLAQLAGEALDIPVNYICSNHIPPTQLENPDTGGPLVYFGAIVAVNIGLFPHLQGRYNADKINAHLIANLYIDFINDITRY